MGYSKKDAIAKLNRERREAKAAKRRKVAVRKRIVRFLIVCEGTRVMRNIGMKRAMLISTTFSLLLEMSNWPKIVLVSSVSNIQT